MASRKANEELKSKVAGDLGLEGDRRKSVDAVPAPATGGGVRSRPQTHPWGVLGRVPKEKPATRPGPLSTAPGPGLMGVPQ